MKKVHVEVRCNECDITDRDDVDACFVFLWDNERGIADLHHSDITAGQVEEAIKRMHEFLLKARTGQVRRN